MLLPCAAIAQIKVKNGTSFTVSPGTTVTVSGNNQTLQLEQTGQLVNNGKIILDSAVTVVEPAGNPITGSGYEETTRNFTSPLTGTNVAGLGAEITTSIAPGVSTIRRGHLAYNDSLGNPGIDRWYEIIPANNNMLNATLRFWYDTTELNGITENDLLLHRSDDNGFSWMNQGGAVNAASNYIEKTGINSFAMHTAFMSNILADTLNASPYCAGGTMMITFTAPGTYTTLNTFTAQLSDAAGSFASPVNIGTLTSTSAGTITAVIPNTTPAGSNYKIRIISSDMALVGAPSAAFAVNSLPSAPAQPAGTTLLCIDSPDMFYTTAGSPDAVSYNWYITPSNAGTLTQMNDSILVSWNNSYSGLVNLTVTGVNACGESVSGSTLTINVDLCTSVSELASTTYLNVHPNPASDRINLRYGTDYTAYEIYSSIGELALAGDLGNDDQTASIDVSTLARGVYYVRVTGNGHSGIHKLVLR